MELMEEYFDSMNHPWVLSNAFDADTGGQQPLGGCQYSVMLRHRGILVGIMGLIEEAWLQSLPAVDPKDIRYSSTNTLTPLPGRMTLGCLML